MNNGQPELDDHLQDDVDAEDIFDDVLGGGDVIDDFHSLKGMISGALGSLGYKFSILIVLLFNFTYTAYNAFARSAKSEISVVSLNNCSCDPNDRSFYSFTTFGFTALWVVFIVICALYNIWNCCTGHGDHDRGSTNSGSHSTDTGVSNGNINTTDTIATEKLIPDKHFWFLKRELKKIISMVLYLNIKKLHNHNDNLKLINSTKKHMFTYMKDNFLEVPKNKFNFVFNKIFRLFKFMLVSTQFFLRLPIVPLLLVQWLDEYSWNCVFGSMKDYCKETTVGYTFDQSMVISFLYMCVLLSIIIGILIKSMPVKILLSNKETSRSKLCLPFQVNNTLFLTNVSFILIIALIYTSSCLS